MELWEVGGRRGNVVIGGRNAFLCSMYCKLVVTETNLLYRLWVSVYSTTASGSLRWSDFFFHVRSFWSGCLSCETQTRRLHGLPCGFALAYKLDKARVTLWYLPGRSAELRVELSDRTIVASEQCPPSAHPVPTTVPTTVPTSVPTYFLLHFCANLHQKKRTCLPCVFLILMERKKNAASKGGH